MVCIAEISNIEVFCPGVLIRVAINVAEILHVYSSMFPVQRKKVETQVCVFECATSDLSGHDVPHQPIGGV